MSEGGPACYRNWRAEVAGEPAFGAWEAPIYSDTHVVDQVLAGLGPYKLLNALPSTRGIDPTIVLFGVSHLNPSVLPSMKETNLAGFTGSLWLADEIAALLSLAMGSRFMAGGQTRSYTYGDSQLGSISGDRIRPIAPFLPGQFARPVLPRAMEEQKRLTVAPLDTLPTLKPVAATALVRAARSYRDALWIAEAEPELAWLLMVSALEVAAVDRQIEATEPIEILRASKPTLVKKLGADALEEVARALSRELRATARFLDFMGRFMPSPPEHRPPQGFQLSWSTENLRDCMKKIYDHRSHALHEGIPFPPPMCYGPDIHHKDWAAPIETIAGLAAATAGGVWERKDLPMPLHTFEYIARGALLNWWSALAVEGAAAPNG